MYKIFINNKCIFLGCEAINLSDKSHYFYRYTSKKHLFHAINEFEKNENFDKMYVFGNPDKILSSFSIICAAGGVVEKNDQVLFIFRRGKWDIPKGKIDKGEKPREAAIREVMEETGVIGLKINDDLPSTYHIYIMDGKRVIKKTYWYKMSCENDAEMKPQQEEDITEVKWISKKDIPEILKNSYNLIGELLGNI